MGISDGLKQSFSHIEEVFTKFQDAIDKFEKRSKVCLRCNVSYYGPTNYCLGCRADILTIIFGGE